MSMRLALGLLLITVTCGCHACNPQTCGPCGPAGTACGTACPPCVCVESPCYCRKLDDWNSSISARFCACRHLSGRECRDYRMGFTQAFIDVAQGKTGEAPPVPPERYWDVCFRSPGGHDRAADWYAGYREGASQALARCGGTCQTVPSSGAAYQSGIRRGAGWNSEADWTGGAPALQGHVLPGHTMSGCPCGR